MIVSGSAEGSTLSPYVDFNYQFDPAFNTTFHYRYNHRNYDTADNSGRMDRDDTHQLVMYLNLNINETWAYTFEPDYFIHVNNYHSRNGKDYNRELNNKLIYMLSKNWKP